MSRLGGTAWLFVSHHTYIIHKTSSVITTLIIEKKHYMHKILVYRQYEWVWLSQWEQTGVRHSSSMSTKSWCSKSLGSIFHMFNLTENVKPQLKCGHRFWMNILLNVSISSHSSAQQKTLFSFCLNSVKKELVEFAERTLFSTRALQFL